MKQKDKAFPKDVQATLRILTTPNDANVSGDIFGGWLMSQIDLAGSIEAVRRANGRVATVAVKNLHFIRPLFVGDVVSFYAMVKQVGKTSLTVSIDVFASRREGRDEPPVWVSEAELVYVAVSSPGQPRPVPQGE